MNQESKKIFDAWRDTDSKRLNKHVFINPAKLAEVAEKHVKNNFEIPNWRFDGVYPKHEWAFAAFQLLANCLNFAFNIFEKPDEKYMVAVPDGPKPLTGAFAMDRKIYEWFGETIPQSDDIYQAFGDVRKTERFFRDMNEIPFSELRHECAMDFANNLVKYYQGNPLNLLEDATVWDEASKRSVLRAFNNGKGLVELLVKDFPVAYGADIRDFNGQKLAFNKRAMLVAIVLHGRALDSKEILPPVIDIEEVGPVCDYELPKALRCREIFSYSAELAELVDNWKEISENSQMEVELRAATAVACDGLLKKINKFRKACGLSQINICHLDYWLWEMGKEATISRPHLTRTNAY